MEPGHGPGFYFEMFFVCPYGEKQSERLQFSGFMIKYIYPELEGRIWDFVSERVLTWEPVLRQT